MLLVPLHRKNLWHYPGNGFQIMDKRPDIVEDSILGPSPGCLPNKITGGKGEKSYGAVGQASMCR
jgi:hypothetical protein